MPHLHRVIKLYVFLVRRMISAFFHLLYNVHLKLSHMMIFSFFYSFKIFFFSFCFKISPFAEKIIHLCIKSKSGLFPISMIKIFRELSNIAKIQLVRFWTPIFYKKSNRGRVSQKDGYRLIIPLLTAIFWLFDRREKIKMKYRIKSKAAAKCKLQWDRQNSKFHNFSYQGADQIKNKIKEAEFPVSPRRSIRSFSFS